MKQEELNSEQSTCLVLVDANTTWAIKKAIELISGAKTETEVIVSNLELHLKTHRTEIEHYAELSQERALINKELETYYHAINCSKDTKASISIYKNQLEELSDTCKILTQTLNQIIK